MFADDTNIFYSSKDVKNMVSTCIIEDDLEILNNLLKVNKLCVNVKKCNFMIIQGNNNKFKEQNILK